MTGHHWITGANRSSRRAALETLTLPGAIMEVDAHRRLRGPYTAAGTIIRLLVPELLERVPDVVAAHTIEILSVAPELRATVPAAPETLTSLAVPEERTRFYSRLRTRRIAHGLAEFLRDAQTGEAVRTLVFENVEHTDPTDLEFIAVLLRRLDPAQLTLVICSAGEVTAPVGPAFADLAQRHTAEKRPATDGATATAFVESDGTSDDPALYEAYVKADRDEVATLHEARADELEARGEWSLTLGAIAWHREHGTDPSGRGAHTLQEALDYCLNMGFYDATVDLGVRGRAVVDWDRQENLYWMFTTKMTTSLAALGRPEEAEVLYDEARARTSEPMVHLQAAYAMSMLYTRHHREERKDHRKARGWANAAIAFSRQLADPTQRAFYTAFNRNGLALIEVHQRNLPAALALVDSALADLDRQLEPDKHRLHRSVLVYNRAQVLAGLGDTAAALADYSKVIAEDPNYSEYYFERANLHRRAGHLDAALTDYDTAIALSPPYPEAYYNRADLLAENGFLDKALDDFSEVLELDPENVDARINRAGLLLDLDPTGELGLGDTVDTDVRAGLVIDPGNGHLLCLAARLAEHRQDTSGAETLYTAALDASPELTAAWSGRAVLRFSRGDIDGALADLTQALQIEPDPVALYNRGIAHQSRQNWAQAVADFTAALDLTGDDPDLHFERGRSHAELGDSDSARLDLHIAARSEDSEHRDEARRLLATLPVTTVS